MVPLMLAVVLEKEMAPGQKQELEPVKEMGLAGFEVEWFLPDSVLASE